MMVKCSDVVKEENNVVVFEIDRIRGVINGYDELKQMQIG